MTKQQFKIKFLIPVGIIVILMGMFTHFGDDNNVHPLLQDVFVESSELINPSGLTDHQSMQVMSDRFINHWSFVFFGFTNCPDVCPATLSQLVQINKHIQAKGPLDNVPQYIFVSVDPERDTTSHLAAYINYFDSSFTAMTGTERVISNFEEQLGAFHRIEKKSGMINYSVQHSADIFLIDPEGRLTGRFTPPLDIKRVLIQFEMIVDLHSKNTHVS